MMKITRLLDQFKYPPKHKAKLSTLHADIIDYVISHYQKSRAFKGQIVKMLNSATAVVVLGESCDMDLTKANPSEIAVLEAS